MPPKASDKPLDAQAAWLRRRRSSMNEPMASPPSAITGMTKRGLSIVPPHCRSRWKVFPSLLVNLNHLSLPDVSCLGRCRREVIEAPAKAMQRRTHPDHGGSDADFQEVQDVIAEASQ